MMKKFGYCLIALLVLSACQRETVPVPTPSDPASQLPVQTAVARIEIRTENAVAVDSKDPVNYRPCTVKVAGEGDSMEASGLIRGRGNSTWNWYPKKPYRIKLDASASLLGMPRNRDWVLLADYRDVTHMMNATGFFLAGALGLPHANHIRYVNLSLNGEELGLYALTEQVEEGGHRVPLDPTEGILLALDINDGPDDEPRATNNFWSEVFDMACAVKYPDNATRAVSKRVKAEFALLEEAIDEKDWEAVQALLDVESMVHYILIQEIIGNVEMDNNPSMRSGYIHRYSSGDTWVMGPLWDCDGGFSYNWGDMYDYWGWGHTFFENYRYLVFGSDPYHHAGAYGSTASDFFCRLFGIPAFVALLKERWKETHNSLLDSLLDYLDTLEELIGEAARDDMELWGIDNYDHETEVRGLMTWLANRFNYLDTVIRKYPVK